MIFSVGAIPPVASKLPLAFANGQMEALQGGAAHVGVAAAESILCVGEARIRLTDDSRIQEIVLRELEV